MKKLITLFIALLFVNGAVFAGVKGPFGYDLEKDIYRNRDNNKTTTETSTTPPSTPVDFNDNKTESDGSEAHASGDNDWEKATSYYADATLSQAISKYKYGNYSGCLQELISLTKKDPFNPVVYYYLGMTYTQVGNRQQAINAYEAVINMNASETLTQYATKGRDCLTGGPTCAEPETGISNENELDRFINAPYGNGFSDELNKQIKEKELQNIKKRIENSNELQEQDIKKIRNFDRQQSKNSEVSEKIAENSEASVNNEDILSAIETLKKAGVTVSINPYQMPYAANDEYMQLSMMLGNNNYNNNNSMMNMLPMLMAQNNGKNIDPQVIQTMMMSSMLPDFTLNDKKDY